jgi:copper chaperone CopZ
MKYLLLFILLMGRFPGFAQFKSADLRAAGLTCAMCSNAINKSLQTLKFVQKVDVDLNHSSFLIFFREGEELNIDAVRRKVEDAGFSVASLTITADLQEIQLSGEGIAKIDNQFLCLLNYKEQVVKARQTFRIIERGYLSDREYKKYQHQSRSWNQCESNKDSGIVHVVIL